MKKNKSIMILCPIIVILLTISLTGCVFRYGENIYEYSNFEYNVDENTILDVNNMNGQIEIDGWENDTISFHFIKKTNERYGEDEFDKVDINIDEIGNKIVVETVYLENTNHVSVSMKINVPNHVIIGSVNTHNGGIYLSNLNGDIEADTKNGPIYINNIDGFVNALDEIVLNPEKRIAMGRAAQKFARDHYSAEIVIPKYLHYYQTVIRG